MRVLTDHPLHGLEVNYNYMSVEATQFDQIGSACAANFNAADCDQDAHAKRDEIVPYTNDMPASFGAFPISGCWMERPAAAVLGAARLASFELPSQTHIELDLMNSIDCPCLSAFPPGIIQGNGEHFVSIGGGTFSYPVDYGLGSCRIQDDGLPPSCDKGANNANWCTSRWCYVDQNNCNQAVTASSYHPGKDLFYSYEACQ